MSLTSSRRQVQLELVYSAIKVKDMRYVYSVRSARKKVTLLCSMYAEFSEY